MAVELKSHLPIERQARVIVGGKGLADLGFGAEVKHTLRQRADFLTEQGLAEHRGACRAARNLLATLRGRELAQAAQLISTETGLEHRSVADGQRVAGTYRRSVMLASGRYAILDNGKAFSLGHGNRLWSSALGNTSPQHCVGTGNVGAGTKAGTLNAADDHQTRLGPRSTKFGGAD